MSKEKTIGEIFKDGIPKFSQIRVYRKNPEGYLINTKIPRREWWRYEKCVPEDVLRGIDGSITVYVNEKAKGVVSWQ